MKKNVLKKGFTLIELLVVVAIIGILASVVLASLNSARAKGSDAAIKAALSGARAQAELYYDTKSGTYAGVCTDSTIGIKAMIDNATKKLSSASNFSDTTVAFTYNKDGGDKNGSAVCHDSASAWAAVVSLKGPTVASSGWCVDSTGASKEILAAGVPASDFTCD